MSWPNATKISKEFLPEENFVGLPAKMGGFYAMISATNANETSHPNRVARSLCCAIQRRAAFAPVAHFDSPRKHVNSNMTPKFEEY